MFRLLLCLLIFLSSLVIAPVYANVYTQDVIVTATPTYVGISVTPLTWILNGITGDHKMRVNTTYYSNPLGDTVSPSPVVLNTECRFTLVNSSTIATDITLDIADFIGGDASVNSNLGTNGPTNFGAYSYVSGDLFVAKVVAKSFLSSILISTLPALTNRKFGIELTTQSNPWVSGISSSSITTVTATEH